MKTITQKALIASTNIPAALIRAVIKQSGGYEYFTQTAPDVANHGASCGSNGRFTYYRDTVPFARKNKAAILEMAKQQADDIYGKEKSAYQMMADFSDIKNAEIGPDELAEVINRPFHEDEEGATTQVFNTLAWYALEEVSRAYNDLLENQDED